MNGYTCDNCGNGAKYNTPHRHPDGRLFCERCAHETTGVRMVGLNQSTLEPNNVYCEDGIIIWYGWQDKHYEAWINGGSVGFPITDSEWAECTLDELFELIKGMQREGKWRCTACKRDFGSDTGHKTKLFAGRLCPGCHTKYLEQIEEEKREGHVCTMCGKPYGACYC